MASLNVSDENMSLSQDSDELEEMYCEHCEKDEKKYVPAEVFCVECVEYMCSMCLRYHKRYAKDHSIQDKVSMPQDFCFDKCPSHKDQLIKFYCDACDEIGCSECKSSDHNNCKNVNHLPKVAERIERSKELSDLIENVDSLSKQVDENECHINSVSLEDKQAVSTITKHKEEVFAAFKKQQQDFLDSHDKKMEETITRLKEERQQLVEAATEKLTILEEKFIDEETEIMKKIEDVKNCIQGELKSLLDRNLKKKTEMKALTFDLKKQQKIGQRCKIFITMQTFQKNIENIKMDALKVKKEICVDFDKYSVMPNVKRLEWNNLDKFFFFKELPSSRRNRIASYHSDIKIKLAGWSSLCLLSDTTLLITDFTDGSLKICPDVKASSENYDTVKMSASPWAVTKVEDNKVAVTFPSEGIVRLITFSASMTVTDIDDIKVGGKCYGIAYGNNNFVISYDTGIVQILDISGNILKAFDTYSDGTPLPTGCQHLALSQDNTTIYLSYSACHKVTSMTFDGRLNAVYEDEDLTGPCQLAVDGSGTVYVCGTWSGKVHQLSSDLTKVKILLDDSHGMYFPACMAYCKNSTRLYVGMYDNLTIKVFDISLK